MARFFVAPVAVEAPYKAGRKAWVPPKVTIAGRAYCAHVTDDGKHCPVWVSDAAYCRKHA